MWRRGEWSSTIEACGHMTDLARSVLRALAASQHPMTAAEIAGAVGVAWDQQHKAMLNAPLSQLADQAYAQRIAGARRRYEITDRGRRLVVAAAIQP